MFIEYRWRSLIWEGVDRHNFGLVVPERLMEYWASGWKSKMANPRAGSWPRACLAARGKSRHGIRPSLRPAAAVRCDSVTYSRYACLLFLVCLSSWGGTDCGVSKKGAPCGKSLIFHRGVPGDEGASGLSFQGFQVGMCLFASGGSQGGPAPPAPVNAASGDSRRRAVTQPSSRLGSVAPA